MKAGHGKRVEASHLAVGIEKADRFRLQKVAKITCLRPTDVTDGNRIARNRSHAEFQTASGRYVSGGCWCTAPREGFREYAALRWRTDRGCCNMNLGTNPGRSRRRKRRRSA